MKKSFHFLIFILILFFIFPGCKNQEEAKKADPPLINNYQAGPINLNLIVSKQKITIAEKLQLTLKAQINKDYEVEFPELIEELNEFQIRDFHYNSPKMKDKDHIEVSMEYDLEPYLSGEYTIPPLPVYFWKTEEGKEKKHQIETDEVIITVTSLLEEDYQTLMIKDIEGPLAPKSRLWIILLVIFFALLIIGAIITGLIFYFKKKEKKEITSYISAYQLAIDRLEKLVKKNLVENQQVKEFYYELSNILRKYIEERFHLKAPEQTTEEFLENLKKNTTTFGEEEKSTLITFLNHSDPVKYAKHQPADDEIQTSFNHCKNFIIQTRDDSVVLPEDQKDSLT
ncbi:MAG: hypothetical protein MJB14_03490 [Spirochaetes bacterium]|nr:hypothetical protein [Spirochaetota bacterium]